MKHYSPLRQLEEILGVDPIKPIEPITVMPVQPHFRKADLPPYTPPATPEDQLAREAAAAIEREDGYWGCAEHRLNGAYDGDNEHRTALKAIELFKHTRDGSEDRNSLPTNQ